MLFKCIKIDLKAPLKNMYANEAVNVDIVNIISITFTSAKDVNFKYLNTSDIITVGSITIIANIYCGKVKHLATILSNLF